MNSLEKWKKAVVHLECLVDRQTAAEDLQKLWPKLEEGLDKITQEELSKILESEVRDPRHSGTAVFLLHNGRRYLVTARHVVYDEVAARRWKANRIYNLIFRVPSLDEFLNWDSVDTLPNPFSKHLRSIDPRSYTLSDPRRHLDLAVISLDWSNSEFADELSSLGYVPVSMDDIADEPSAEGVEVFTVGYLGATSALVGLKDHLPSALHFWMSKIASIPTFSFGRVSMLHDHLPSYWCDISVYPGNSGGPIVENGRLVGIVSEQPTIQSEVIDEDYAKQSLTARTRIPFGWIIKGKFVKDLLDTQIRKDTAKHV